MKTTHPQLVNYETGRELFSQKDNVFFNRKFDIETGEETVSFYVKYPHMLDVIEKSEDAKGLLKYFACCWCGRAADELRCRKIALRPTNDDRIEVRLRFGPPWYWSQIDPRKQHAANSGPTSTESGALGPV